jgi:hypothetical protein
MNVINYYYYYFIVIILYYPFWELYTDYLILLQSSIT